MNVNPDAEPISYGGNVTEQKGKKVIIHAHAEAEVLKKNTQYQNQERKFFRCI